MVLRKLLEPITGPLTKAELKELLELASDDIKINRVMWDKRTSIDYLIQVVKTCVILLNAIKKTA